MVGQERSAWEQMGRGQSSALWGSVEAKAEHNLRRDFAQGAMALGPKVPLMHGSKTQALGLLAGTSKRLVGFCQSAFDATLLL